MTIKRIHVNQHKIKRNIANINNNKDVELEKVLSLKTSKGTQTGNTINVLDKQGNVLVAIKYRPFNKLSCGATAWVETELDVEVLEGHTDDSRMDISATV